MACAASRAPADTVNHIYQHNQNLQPGTHYTIREEPFKDVTIILGVEGQTFEFEATLEENGQYHGPGDINGITADPNAGPVTISVVGHNGHEFGARDIGAIDLDAAGVTGSIAALEISRDLAALDDVTAFSATGDLLVQGALLNNLDIQHLDSEVILGVLGGNVSCSSMHSLWAYYGTIGLPVITVAGPWGRDGTDTLSLVGPADYIDIWGNVSGEIKTADLDSLWISGRVTESGSIKVTGAFDLYTGEILGPIEIWGDIEDGQLGSLRSTMRVHGSLTGTLVVGELSGALILEDALDGALFVNEHFLGNVEVWGDWQGFC